jgi:hypothetical protein
MATLPAPNQSTHSVAADSENNRIFVPVSFEGFKVYKHAQDDYGPDNQQSKKSRLRGQRLYTDSPTRPCTVLPVIKPRPALFKWRHHGPGEAGSCPRIPEERKAMLGSVVPDICPRRVKVARHVDGRRLTRWNYG